MMKTSGPIEATGQGAHLFEAIKKAAEAGVTIRKALEMREEADRELDTLAKAHSAEHGVDYFTAYERVTQEGVGRNLLEASMGLSDIIANPNRQAD